MDWGLKDIFRQRGAPLALLTNEGKLVGGGRACVNMREAFRCSEASAVGSEEKCFRADVRVERE